MFLGHLIIGVLAGLAAASLALLSGLSPWQALAIHSVAGTAAVLLLVLAPLLLRPVWATARACRHAGPAAAAARVTRRSVGLADGRPRPAHGLSR